MYHIKKDKRQQDSANRIYQSLRRVFDSWSSDILATYRFLYTLYIRTFFIMSIFYFSCC